MNKIDLQKRMLLMMSYDSKKTSKENIEEQYKKYKKILIEQGEKNKIDFKIKELPSDATQVVLTGPNGKKIESNPNLVSTQEIGNQEPWDTHNVLMWMSVVSFFVPYVGPYLSVGFQLANAELYRQEEKYYEMGLELALAVIPFDEILKLFPITKKYSSEVIKNVLKKIGKKASKWTDEELEILEEFKNVWDTNTLKEYKKLFRKWWINLMYPHVIRKSILKLSSRKLYMFLFNLRLFHPNIWKLLKGTFKVGSVYVTADQFLKMLEINPSSVSEGDKEIFAEFVNQSLGGTTMEEREEILKSWEKEWLKTYEDSDSTETPYEKKIVGESKKLIRKKLLSEGVVSPQMVKTGKNFIDDLLSVAAKKGSSLIDYLNPFLKKSLDELDYQTKNAFTKLQSQGLNSLDNFEIQRILASLNMRKLGSNFFNEYMVLTKDTQDDWIVDIINIILKKVKGQKQIDMYLDLRNYIKRKVFGYDVSKGDQIPQDSAEFIDGYIDELMTIVTKNIQESNPSLYSRLVGSTFENIEGKTDQELRDLFNPKKWDNAQSLGLSNVEASALAENFDKIPFWRKFKNLFRTDLKFMVSKIESMQKLLKKLSEEDLPTDVQEKIYQKYTKEMRDLYLNHRNLFKNMQDWVSQATQKLPDTNPLKKKLTQIMEEDDYFKKTDTIISNLSDTNPLLVAFKTGFRNAFELERKVLNTLGDIVSFRVKKGWDALSTFFKRAAGDSNPPIENTTRDFIKVGIQSLDDNVDSPLWKWFVSGSRRGYPGFYDNKTNYAKIIRNFDLPTAKKSYLTELLMRMVKWKVYWAFLTSMGSGLSVFVNRANIKACKEGLDKLRDVILNDPDLKELFYKNEKFDFTTDDESAKNKMDQLYSTYCKDCPNPSTDGGYGNWFTMQFFNIGLSHYKGDQMSYVWLWVAIEVFINEMKSLGIKDLIPGFWDNIAVWMFNISKDFGTTKFLDQQLALINSKKVQAEEQINNATDELDKALEDVEVSPSPTPTTPSPTPTTQQDSTKQNPTIKGLFD